MSVAVKDITVGAGGLRFDSRAGQTGTVANGPPPLQRFFEAVLLRRCIAGMVPATRYMLRYNTASITTI